MFCSFCGSLFRRSDAWLVCGRCGHARLLAGAETAQTPERNCPGRMTPSETPVIINPTPMIMAADATGMSRNAA